MEYPTHPALALHMPICVCNIASIQLCIYNYETTDAVTVNANFNMAGVSGTISFNQPSPENSTVITVMLTGLDQFPSETFPWHVHSFPFTTQRDPCSNASVGGHFDPFMTRSIANYSMLCQRNCSLCEVGDLSGKFGQFNASASVSGIYTDSYLSLYGVHSILGRSVVIHRSNGDRWVCANIEYPGDVIVAYSPFRTVLAGDIFFIEPHSPANLTTVFTRLSYISGPTNSSSHNWYIYNDTIGSDGDCTDEGPRYDPRDINAKSFDYYSYCHSSNQTVCEVGDLARKSSRLNFLNGHSVLFYTDINLPVRVNRLNETILNRSVVIDGKNFEPYVLSCADLLEYTPRIASARFQEDGVTGGIVFKQSSPFSPTTVTLDFTGLSYRAGDYHIHKFPVDEAIQGSSKCAAAGGHFNPRNIIRDASSPTTLDAYEIGDLSGKSSQTLTGFGSINFMYSDPYLPLFGVDSIVGRSIVIHCRNSDRWLCANIMYDDTETVSITASISSDTLQGRLVLTQLANDPFSETTIFLNLSYTEPFTNSSVSTVMQSSSSMTTASSITMMTTSLMSGSTPTPVTTSMASANSTSNISATINLTSSIKTTANPTMTPPMNTSTVEPMPGSGDTDSSSSSISRRKKDAVRRQVQTPRIFLTIQDTCRLGNDSYTNSSQSCSPSNQLACSIDDLIGKHGVLSLGTELLTDLNLPLTGPNSSKCTNIY